MVNLFLQHFLSKKGQLIGKRLTVDGEFVLNTFNRMFEYIKSLVEKLDVMMTANKPSKNLDQFLKIFSFELYEIEGNLRYFKAALLNENLKDVAVVNDEGSILEALVSEKHTWLHFKILKDKVAYIQRDLLKVRRIFKRRTTSHSEKI